METVGTTQTDPKTIAGITSPRVLKIIQDIKGIQREIKKPENADFSYAMMYSHLQDMFPEFSENHKYVFNRVVNNKNMDIVAASLYYLDQFERGLITELELGEMLARKHYSPELFEEYEKTKK